MRIVRYPLEIVDYQQVQPLWPGRILSVAPGRREYVPGRADTPRPMREQRIDMWAIDNSDAPKQANVNGPRLPPVLGVWIVGTGNPIDPAMIEADALFHGTCVMENNLVWHVFSAVVGQAEDPKREPAPTYSSVDDMVERIKERRRAR
jgi:hypothetical protein